MLLILVPRVKILPIMVESRRLTEHTVRTKKKSLFMFSNNHYQTNGWGVTARSCCCQASTTRRGRCSGWAAPMFGALRWTFYPNHKVFKSQYFRLGPRPWSCPSWLGRTPRTSSECRGHSPTWPPSPATGAALSGPTWIPHKRINVKFGKSNMNLTFSIGAK